MRLEQPWSDRSRQPDDRARSLVEALTFEEKIGLVSAPMAVPPPGHRPPPDVIGSAAATAGIPRVGLPALQESDAGLGISNPNQVRPDDASTALPSALLLGSTFDPALADACGVVVGAESVAMGFAVQLAGGANLVREPRCGRNFEYLAEDALLTGVMAGAAIAGIQSQGVVSTVKHFALNAQETGRVVVSSDIGEAALRESDLLAFEIAIERGRPGSVMTAYNRVNGVHASEHEFLLDQVLKRDWGYPGFVMSDWGGTHSTVAAALAGLDRQSGSQLDQEPYFGEPLAQAVRRGDVPEARLDDMVFRLLRAVILAGVLDRSGRPAVNLDAHQQLSRKTAEQGIVLLRNDGTLPLSNPATVLVVGGHADSGVLSGGGSSQVSPVGSLREAGTSIAEFQIPRTYHPSSPVAALSSALPSVEVTYHDGADRDAAARAAERADVVVVVVEQWTAEGHDVADLGLGDDQDALVAAVASANRRTVVVVESGGPVLMPWLPEVGAVLAAWYPGSRGGEAIAAVLTGQVCPSGRLPVTFPQTTAQLPRAVMRDASTATSSPGAPPVGAFSEDYDIEGADVGYRWYERVGLTPQFAFGFGLSYTSFAYAELQIDVAEDGGTGIPAVRAGLVVSNTGARSGIDTPQLYVRLPDAAKAPTSRLAGWARVALDPGETRQVWVDLEPRLLATYDTALPGWRWTAGPYGLLVGTDARTPVLQASFELASATAPP